jgi:hypothetical protein
MQVISATQAISPAIERTRNLLFRPFEFGTFLKLCAVAVLTEGFSGNFNSNHTSPSQAHAPSGPMLFHFNPALIALIVVIALVFIIVAIVIFYLIVRLRFALFDCLIHQSTLIAPGWHKYRQQAIRFFLFSIFVGVVFFVLVVVALAPFALGFWRVYQQSQQSGQFPPAQMIALILPLIPVVLLIALIGFCVDLVMHDFMLPHFALEGASVGEACAAVWDRIASEPGAFLLYAVLRVVLPFVAVIALTIALFIPCVILFGALGLAMAGVHAVISHAAMPFMVMGWFVEVALGLIIVGLALFVAVCFGGPLSIAIRNYALLFYGGRYPALGNILSPPPAPMGMHPGVA